MEKKIYEETGEEIAECYEVVPAEEMIPEKRVGGGAAPAAAAAAVAVAVVDRRVKKEEKRSRKQA